MINCSESETEAARAASAVYQREKRSEGAEETRAEAIRRCLPLVRIIVGKMRDRLPAYADLDDIIGVGTVGLMSAIDNYDPSKGASLESYASIRIRGAILDELRRLDYMPRSARSSFRRLNETVARLEQELGRTPSDLEIQEELGMDGRAYRKMRLKASPIKMMYLDSPAGLEEVDLHEAIADEAQPPGYARIEKEELVNHMQQGIERLPERERKILAMYYHQGLRLAEIAAVFHLSEARICQIHAHAVATLRVQLAAE